MPFAVGLVVGLAIAGVLAVIIRQAIGGRLQPNATLATAIAVLALVLAIVALARARDDATPTSDVQASSATTSTTDAPATTTTAPATTTVPNVVGLSEVDARQLLTSRGLEADVETLGLGTVPPGFVLAQTPNAQSVVPRGTLVVVTVSGTA